jgi:hypothetical protein
MPKDILKERLSKYQRQANRKAEETPKKQAKRKAEEMPRKG